MTDNSNICQLDNSLHYDASGDGGPFGCLLVRHRQFIFALTQGGEDANITLDEALYPPFVEADPVAIGIYHCNRQQLGDENMLNWLHENDWTESQVAPDMVVKNMTAARLFITFLRSLESIPVTI